MATRNDKRTRVVPLGAIRLDGDTQPREEIDTSVVAEYAEAYAAKKALPPVVLFFDGVDHWLADGFHRYFGARRAGLTEIACEVHSGTVEDARWFSYAANQTHGLRRSNADKERAIKAALRHPKGSKESSSAIAEYLGVTDKTVTKYREEMETTSEIPKSTKRKGKDGRTINTSKIGKARKATVATDSPRALAPDIADDRKDDDSEAGEIQEGEKAFDIVFGRARLENAIFAELSKWPDDAKHEAAPLLKRIALELET